MKRLAGEITPIKNFTKRQKKLLNEFYVREAIPAMQAKYEVLRMSVTDLNKLYFKLLELPTVRDNPNGSAFDEKLTIICFCVRHKRIRSKEITRSSLSFWLGVLYESENF